MRAKKKNIGVPIMNRTSIGVWGPSGWTYLHSTSFAYSETPNRETRENMLYFLKYFARVIPCYRCRIDFTKYIDAHLKDDVDSKYLASKTTLIHFLIDAHNYVNQKLNKRIYTYNEVYDLYLKPPSCMPRLLWMTVLVLILFVCISLTQRHRMARRT